MGANLLAALGLMLIVEGMLPLVSPPRWREAMRRIGELRDGQIRFMGCVASLTGVALLALAA
jgi:uncharacterized protein YjeT (DUF2065 family)